MQYYSVLIRAAPNSDKPSGEDIDDDRDIEEVYRIQLPGNPMIGEGKPEKYLGVSSHASFISR